MPRGGGKLKEMNEKKKKNNNTQVNINYTSITNRKKKERIRSTTDNDELQDFIQTFIINYYSVIYSRQRNEHGIGTW